LVALHNFETYDPYREREVLTMKAVKLFNVVGNQRLAGAAHRALVVLVITLSVLGVVVGEARRSDAATGVEPSPPQSLKVSTYSSTSATVVWTPPSSDGGSAITDYAIEYSPDGVIWTVVNHARSTALRRTISGLTTGTTYRVRVAAVNSIGRSSWAELDPNFVSIRSSGIHTCALVSNGRVRCWGDNTYGQLGTGSTISSSTPVEVTGITDAMQLTVGSSYSCVLLRDRTVRCWGFNWYGQLGTEGSVDRNYFSTVPVAVTGLSEVMQISAGGSHTCALLLDQSIRCWGYNYGGMLGNGSTRDSRVPVPVTGISTALSVSSAGNHTCALLDDSTVKCWGDNQVGQLGHIGLTYWYSPEPVDVSGLSGVLSLSSGGGHSCAILADRSLQCWGSNSAGQLGQGYWGLYSFNPVTVNGLTDVRSVDVGYEQSCVVLGTGAAKCWGINNSGQMGDGTSDRATLPVAVKLPLGVSTISVGYLHTCALSTAAPVKCWGGNEFGQLGNGSMNTSTTPISVQGIGTITAITPPSTPTAPTVVLTRVGDSSATITFTPGGDGGSPIVKYQYKINDGTWTEAARFTSPFTITRLTNFTTYSIRIRAVNAVGNGATSAAVRVRPMLTGPTITSAVALNRTSIHVEFSTLMPAGGTVSGYTVTAYRKNTTTTAAACNTTNQVHACNLTKLTAGTEYDIRVKAFFTLTGDPVTRQSLESGTSTVRTKS